MDFKPVIGTRVIMTNSKHGTVTAYPKKEKHQDKVTVTKDNEVGCNSVVMVKYKNLALEIHPLLPSTRDSYLDGIMQHQIPSWVKEE